MPENKYNILPPLFYIPIPTAIGVVNAIEYQIMDYELCELSKLLRNNHKWDLSTTSSAFGKFSSQITNNEKQKNQWIEWLKDLASEHGIRLPEQKYELKKYVSHLKPTDHLLRCIGRYIGRESLESLYLDIKSTNRDAVHMMIGVYRGWSAQVKPLEAICNREMKEAFEPYRDKGYPIDKWQGSLAPAGPAGNYTEPSYRTVPSDVIEKMWELGVLPSPTDHDEPNYGWNL